MNPAETVQNGQILYAIWDKEKNEWFGGLPIPDLYESEKDAQYRIDMAPDESWALEFWERQKKNRIVLPFAKVIIGEK